MTIQGKKLDEHLKQPPPRIEFLEYLKAEFISWRASRISLKGMRYAKKQRKKRNKKLQKELAELSGRKLAAFSGYLLRRVDEKSEDKLLHIYGLFQFDSESKESRESIISQYGLFENHGIDKRMLPISEVEMDLMKYYESLDLKEKTESNNPAEP